MTAIERDNPSLKGVLPKGYARPGLHKLRLGKLIDLVSNIGLGDSPNRSKGILGSGDDSFLMQPATGTASCAPRQAVALRRAADEASVLPGPGRASSCGSDRNPCLGSLSLA